MSKTEKELLELAAKSIGMKTTLLPSVADPDRPYERPWQIEDSEWNPLEDDGDALRLAVDLEIDASIQPHMQRAVAMTNRNGYSVVEFGDDRYSAVRRAIVRAAAEIGKAMP